MEDVVRHLHSSAEQFVIGNVTQLVERRQVWRAVPAQSNTESMRLRSGTLVRPCHALVEYVKQATTVTW